ncbi:MAG TPA: protoporphyrinogen oxidase [Gammaproteobacteria bacterium]|nr:protoporphyrinogen oxidase [Gammaproteobacteria bacterium]
MDETEVAIVGGGISGLSVAWWLAQRGIPSEIWERAHHPGGKIRSHAADGYLTERAANLILNFRPEIDLLLRRSGLERHRIRRSLRAEAHRYLLLEGSLRPLPAHPLRLLLSPIWSWRGKLRLLAEPFIPRAGGEQESVARFVRRRFGAELLEKAMEPFVAGTLAADASQADAAATLPRLTALERRYGSITAGVVASRLLRRRTAVPGEAFSFTGGISTLVEALAAAPGVRLHTGTAATRLARDGSGWLVSGRGAGRERLLRARQLVLCTPARTAARLLSPLDRELGAALAAIPYAPLAVVHTGFRREQIRHPLDGSGFLTPAGAGLSFNGNLWMSSLFPGRAPPGRVLLTSYIGGCRAPQMVEWEEQRLVEALCRDLQPILGLRGEPEWLRIDRHQRALPLYHGAYQRRLALIEQRLRALPGLHLAANYMGGVAVRDRILCGAGLARRIARQPGKRRATVVTAARGAERYEQGAIPAR